MNILKRVIEIAIILTGVGAEIYQVADKPIKRELKDVEKQVQILEQEVQQLKK